MIIIKNPARARPLSANVRRLMTMEREAPINPDVEKIEREVTARDLLYCDMQGRIFMAAVGKGYTMEDFTPTFMNSQLAGVIDHSFSVTGGMETDNVSAFLQMPMLLKSPDTIVDVVVWLTEIVGQRREGESESMAVAQACMDDMVPRAERELPDKTEEALIAEYEYAYWLGYIYRFECLLHDESSRMVYGAFSESFMRGTYEELMQTDPDAILAECAGEICKRIDMLLIGKLWKEEQK